MYIYNPRKFLLLYRGLFSRSSNQEANSTGWNFFGKLPPKDDAKSAKVLPKEEQFVRGMKYRKYDYTTPVLMR